jgi:hypothetical protein
MNPNQTLGSKVRESIYIGLISRIVLLSLLFSLIVAAQTAQVIFRHGRVYTTRNSLGRRRWPFDETGLLQSALTKNCPNSRARIPGWWISGAVS